MAKISWLHISDIHILRPGEKKVTTARDQKTVFNEFLEFMKEHLSKNTIEKPQFVFISGDLAFRGKTHDYDHTENYCVREMIDSIAKLLGIEKKDYAERIFPVPGNHDADQEGLGDKDFEKTIIDFAKDKHKLENMFAAETDLNKERKKHLCKKFTNYCTFVRELWGDNKEDENILDYKKIIPIKGTDRNLNVIGLNTAWVCHSKAKIEDTLNESELTQHLLTRPGVVGTLLKNVNENDITVALMHHDYDITADRRTAVQRQLEKKCDFLLFGHEHDDDWVEPTGKRAHKIHACNFYLNLDKRNSVNIVEVDTGNHEVKMQTIQYRPERDIWTVERDDPQKNKDIYKYNEEYSALIFKLNRNGNDNKEAVKEQREIEYISIEPDRGYKTKVVLAEQILEGCRKNNPKTSFLKRLFGWTIKNNNEEHGYILSKNPAELIEKVAYWEEQVSNILKFADSFKGFEIRSQALNITPQKRELKISDIKNLQILIDDIDRFLKNNHLPGELPISENEEKLKQFLSRTHHKDIIVTFSDLIDSLDFVNKFIKHPSNSKITITIDFVNKYSILQSSMKTMQNSMIDYIQDVLYVEYEGFNKALSAKTGFTKHGNIINDRIPVTEDNKPAMRIDELKPKSPPQSSEYSKHI